MSEEKLKATLAHQNLSLRKLALQSKVSRQSIYALLNGSPIYTLPFVKIIQTLRVAPEEITHVSSWQDILLEKAPFKIRKAILEIQSLGRAHDGSLLLFGSQATGQARPHSDWDFGIYFHKKDEDRKLRLLKIKLQEEVFPYRLDLLNLTQAPAWFIQSIRDESLLLSGNWPPQWEATDA